MTKELELKLLQEIENLKQEIKEIKAEKKEKEEKISFKFSKIKDSDIDSIVDIEKKLDRKIFDYWLINKIDVNNSTIIFLEDLIKNNETLLYSYSEEDLKVNFIIPLLNKVKFKSFENEIRGFYELAMVYEADNFILKGTTDFVVSKGLVKSKKPYFFIQEFKKGKENSDPEPQLLAELIAAVELNNWKSIKGAYIIGENWSFVILEKLGKHKYQFFVSRTFNCTNIEDLKGIYKNLVFIKNEIIEMIKND